MALELNTSNASNLVLAGQHLVLRDVVAQDASQVVQLHERVFGSKLDAAWFEWKYGSKGGNATAIWLGGQMIAHCGAIPRDFFHQGLPSSDIQIGDVMVAPEWRGVLTRHGPFFHVSRALYTSRLGAGNRYADGFGFPSDRHLRLAVTLGLLADAGTMLEVQWDSNAVEKGLSAATFPWCWRSDLLMVSTPEFDATVDHLWEAMQVTTASYSIGVRDARHVRWRYAQRPSARHMFLQLRRPWSTRASGIAVLAPPNANQPRAQWLDWIGPPDALVAARYMCLRAALDMGAQGLTTWVSPAVLACIGSQEVSHQSVAARIGMPTASVTPAPAMAQRRWWLMGGDTDFL